MKVLTGVVLAALVAAPVFAQKTAADRLKSATEDLNEIMNASDKGIPQDLMAKAECIVVIPNLKKGGFIVGAQYGAGFVSCRKKSGVGWTAPAGVKSEGGKFGFLAGGAEADVILLVMNDSGMKHMLQDKFTLGGEISAAAGPLGRDATAQTDAQMRAEILSYSRQRGVYGGLSLNGATLREDDDANKELYGRELKNREILTGDLPVPPAARPFVRALDKTSSRK
ncbi:MAG TPA: lipid-binding SYLF domain-containing protein [Bryobacteraceae bacterium]|nr:lipid-binding SYLF domain-containing protein [Bryobacteraceae bacterium]